jgi:Kef-type K+ transport system membrane component KefB
LLSGIILGSSHFQTGHLTRILLHIIAIVATKIVMLYLAARAMNVQHGSAARMSFFIAQGSEMGSDVGLPKVCRW